MRLWLITDKASGASLGAQIWADSIAPVILSGQQAALAAGGVVLGSGTITTAVPTSGFAAFGTFNLTLGGPFSGTVNLERSFDNGTTWVQATYSDGSAVTFSGPLSASWYEPESGVLYRLNCQALVSGTSAWRVSQ